MFCICPSLEKNTLTVPFMATGQLMKRPVLKTTLPKPGKPVREYVEMLIKVHGQRSEDDKSGFTSMRIFEKDAKELALSIAPKTRIFAMGSVYKTEIEKSREMGQSFLSLADFIIPVHDMYSVIFEHRAQRFMPMTDTNWAGESERVDVDF